MPTTDTELAEREARKQRRARAKAAAKAQGFSGVYALVKTKGADYQLVQRALRFGLTKRTLLGTVDELERLGLLEAVKSAAAG